MKPITENIIEASAIEILQSQGWEYLHGSQTSPPEEGWPQAGVVERENYSQIILVNRLRSAIAKINPHIPADAQEAAVQKVLRIHSPELLHNNEEFHRFLIEKVKVPYQQNGYERSHEVALIDFDNPANNQFLVVNQYTIIENNQNKRPDVLLFVNGIPLVVIELKNATDENANILSAFKQIQTYKAIIPSLFTYNSVCIISDGLECKAGSVSADLSRYMTWPVCVQRTGRKSADGFYVYVLECDNGSYYIGQTENLEKRWQEHISGRGANWTKSHKPVRIIHFEEFNTREESVKRESDLKTGFGRKWIKREIAAGRNVPYVVEDNPRLASRFKPQLETLLKGMMQPATLLDLVRNFIVFEKTTCLRATHRQKKEDAKTGLIQIQTEKKLAAYHQYYAVNKAIESTLIAAGAKNSPPLEGWSQTGVVKRGSKNYFELPYNPKLKENARELRKAGNLSEVLFWNKVKNKQFKSFDFDRQKIIGNYIVDFYCTNCNVVIEIDGSSHDDKQEYDAERDAYLQSLGLIIIHLPVEDVMNNLDGVMEMLYHHPALSGTPPKEGNIPPLTSPKEGNVPPLTSPKEGNIPLLTSPKEGNKPPLTSPKEGNKKRLTSRQKGS
jgi:very-short-patch-repair endonuclease/predicted GIY-YIG superfamily endonuclease